jgi:diguanylate cyclase (GGDEF)-like protein
LQLIPNLNIENILKLEVGSVGCELRDIIKNNRIMSVFQPIVSLMNGEIIGYEGLTRGPENSLLKNPEMLFSEAEKHNLLWELDFICRVNAIKKYSEFNSDKLLFLNVDPNIIKDAHFSKGFTKDILIKNNLSPSSIIFEITEKTSIEDYETFNTIIDNYKSQGYNIAIDDVGSGYSGLTTISETRPKYIKISMSLIENIDKDNFKKALIKAFVEFANAAEMKVIAEGIERVDELNTLIDIGVHYAQGFFLAKPNSSLKEIPKMVKEIILDRNFIMRRQKVSMSSVISIGDLARKDKAVTPSSLCEEALKIFKCENQIQGIPLVDNNAKCVGLLTRAEFFSRIGTQYGWSLYMERPIYKIMDSNPLIVDYNATIEKVSKQIASRQEDKMYDYIVVEKNKKYYGIVPVISILEKMMEIEVNVARYASPLTGLPGNVIIENNLSDKFSNEENFSILYFDLNDFKAYNDKYGFDSGDKVICFTANIIQRHLYFYENSFLGHVGGDDFVAIIATSDFNAIESLCSRIAQEFDHNILRFYSQEDIKKGFINSKDRDGEKASFPIMSISIAVANNICEKFEDTENLSKYVATIKKECKEKSKSFKKSAYIVA